MENRPSVIIREGRHQWKTQAERMQSLGLTEVRYASLHANFNACIEIDKMRITREDPDKEIFAGEVQRWLVGELTLEDWRKIYGRPIYLTTLVLQSPTLWRTSNPST